MMHLLPTLYKTEQRLLWWEDDGGKHCFPIGFKANCLKPETVHSKATLKIVELLEQGKQRGLPTVHSNIHKCKLW